MPRSLLVVAALVLAPALLSACSGVGGHGAVPTSATTSTAPVINGRSQRVLDDAIKEDAPGCSAAVGVEGNVVWTGVRGVANMATGDAITAETVFDIASVSKQFTAAAVLLLAAAGSSRSTIRCRVT